MRFRGETSSLDTPSEKNDPTNAESTSTGKEPGCKSSERRRKRAILWSWTWKTIVISSFLFYFIFPIIILLDPDFASQLIFLSFLRCPVFKDYHLPRAYGLSRSRNIYLPSTDGVTLGVWQVLPSSLDLPHNDEDIPEELFEKVLGDDRPVVLYCHGNSGSRANPHRVEVYKLLSKMGFHVVAVDYRGYGDSTSYTTPNGIHDDVLTVYRWLRERTGKSPFYIWGHSLGTGISTVFTSKICKEEGCPDGLILEAPFNNLLDEVMMHPFAMPWNILPYSRHYFDSAFNLTAPYFQSDANIHDVMCPILILHAEDDWVVPYVLGKKLYDVAVERRPSDAAPVKFVSFGSEGLGHKFIAYSPDLPPLLRDFIK